MNPWGLPILVALALLAAACDGALEKTGLKGLESELKASIGGMMTIVRLEGGPVVAGGELAIAGEGFSEEVRIYLEDRLLEPQAVDPERLALRLPEDARPGMRRLYVEKGGERAMLSLFVRPKDVRPVLAAPPAAVCQGVSYYDLLGAPQTGGKACTPKETAACAGVKVLPPAP
jgi:hypothetical protein